MSDEQKEIESGPPPQDPRFEGYYRPPVAPRSDGFQTLIPTKNAMALAAYYTGVFSLIPCAALVLGPLAVFLGIRGLNRCRHHPELPGKAHAFVGIVLGAITGIANYYFLIQVFLGLSRS